jgi:hypothetical protein
MAVAGDPHAATLPGAPVCLINAESASRAIFSVFFQALHDFPGIISDFEVFLVCAQFFKIANSRC